MIRGLSEFAGKCRDGGTLTVVSRLTRAGASAS
jgi:hypothetical protein